VDFDVRAGEVHALLGENGAGKSTLIKVLTGVHPADAGTFRLDGQDIRPANPSDAVRHGISTVYQEVNLAPNLTVAENVCLGREPRKPWGLDWSAMANRAEKALARIGVQIDVRRRLSRYSIANQQMVAIARALDVDAKILVLDEPTSSLDASEVDQLFAAMRRLKAEGLGIVFVTHFLDQVYAISDPPLPRAGVRDIRPHHHPAQRRARRHVRRRPTSPRTHRAHDWPQRGRSGTRRPIRP